MRVHPTLPALAALLLLATAQAQLPSGAAFAADSVRAQGQVTIVGGLGAIELFGLADQPGQLAITGDRIGAESDFQKSYGSGVVFYPYSNGTLFHSDDGLATSDTLFEEDFRVFLVPLAGTSGATVNVSTEAATLGPSDEDAVTSFDMVDVRDPQTVDVRDCTEVTDLDDAVLRIQGSFRVILWRVDLDLRDSTGTVALLSGESVRPLTGVEGTDVVARDTESRQLYLDVESGNLSMLLPKGIVLGMYLGDLTASTGGSLLVETATGQYQQDGPSQVDVRRDGKALQVAPRAPAEATPVEQLPGVVDDGSPQEAGPLTTAASPSPHSWPKALLAGLAAVPLIALLVIPARRTVGNRRMARLEAAFADQDDATVARGAPALHGDKRHRWAAGAMQVLSLARAGDDAKAMDVLAWMETLPEANTDGLDYLTACIAASRGESQAAAALIAPLLQDDSARPAPARRATGQPAARPAKAPQAAARLLDGEPAPAPFEGYA